MKKIVLFSALEQDLLNKLTNVKKHFSLDEYEVHLVHCHHIQVYMADLIVYTYPTEEQYKEMEEATNKVLSEFASELGLKNSKVHTFFDADPKTRCATFLKDIDAELAVIATQGKKGLETVFESSFASYMNKYSPCDVLVLK